MLAIGLVENDLLLVIAVSGEVIEHTGGCSSRVASHAGGAQLERDTSLSNHLISFSLVVGVGVNYRCTISWWL